MATYKCKRPYMYGTGRRKQSVARVHLIPNGTGAITINGRDIDDYFGLANIVTLIAMVMLGRREAGLILLVRIAMGSVFTGGVSAFIFSIAGGALAYAVMCLTLRPFSGKLLWVVSVFGAVAHNLGQLCAAVLITKTASLFLYAPVLLASAIVTGVFTGFAAMYLIRRLDKTVQ